MTDAHKSPDVESYDRLRRSAQDLIDHGVPPRSRGSTLSAAALQLLYERASKPESAADAFKVLHELQTYQVELDLMYEQLQANEHELNEELAHYRFLYEQAPAAYLILANDGQIIEGNPAAGMLFGKANEELTGKALSALLAPGKEYDLDALIGQSKKQKASVGHFELPDHRPVIISARPSVAGDSILMILTGASAHSAGI